MLNIILHVDFTYLELCLTEASVCAQVNDKKLLRPMRIKLKFNTPAGAEDNKGMLG